MAIPYLIVIAGAGSNVGKTTLVCDLLRQFALAGQPCAAIKLTRGHYRSCGKDPHACCVSDLLGAAPTVRSGHVATFMAGKDTGRYWDAGAQEVHWVIATDAQVEVGIGEALALVKAPTVIIEGTSVLPFVAADLAVLVARGDETKLKSSARRALAQGWLDAWYLTNLATTTLAAPTTAGAALSDLLAAEIAASGLPVYHRSASGGVPNFQAALIQRAIRRQNAVQMI